MSGKRISKTPSCGKHAAPAKSKLSRAPRYDADVIKFWFVVLALLGMCVWAISGCTSRHNSKAEETVELTERQKEILAQEHLPAEYNALNYNQRANINAIEAMLQYLERTYHTDFRYTGYCPPERGHERLTALTNDGDEVILTRTYERGQYRYSDNYTETLANPEYEQALAAFFDEMNMNADKYKIFANVTGFVENAHSDDILCRANAHVFVFIDSSAIGTGELAVLVTKFSPWITAHAIGADNYVRFVAIKPQAFQNVTAEGKEHVAYTKNVIDEMACEHWASGMTYFYRG